MMTYAQLVAGGAAAAGVLLSDHLTGTAVYQDTPVFDAAELELALASEETPLISDEELDAMTEDIDYWHSDADSMSPDVALLVPFPDGLGFDWAADDDDAEVPF